MTIRLMRNTKMEMVDNWNLQYGIGQRVLVRAGNETFEAETDGPASLFGNDTPVIILRGRAGCYALDRVTAV